MKERLCFHALALDTDKVHIPTSFNFPFNHIPNELSLIASSILKKELDSSPIQHDFDVQGKMFGVLMVKNTNGELGFLKAFSGKLDQNEYPEGYVPPIFDLHDKDSFFKKEEKKVDLLTEEILTLENTTDYQNMRSELKEAESELSITVDKLKDHLKKSKTLRKEARRLKKKELSSAAYEEFNHRLNEQSKQEQITFKKERKALQMHLELLRQKFKKAEGLIEKKKRERKKLSAQIQAKIFEHYSFYNAKKEKKNLLTLFENTVFGTPPSGAGECCAPRLLQYAYENGLSPICFTEFWWGKSPESEIRIHQNHYPACRGKCGPILQHMLEGIEVDSDPLIPVEKIKAVPVLYEDDLVIAVEKPANLLSVPGKEIEYSLTSIVKKQFPTIQGPGLVHRLDYETSGIVLIGKTMDSYKALQKQFLSRTVQKKYVALLERPIDSDLGEINLPLTLDIFNRPRQLVCFEKGKQALTKYRLINNKKGTRVVFFPVTGRTHQLRVHAAHQKGLNSPILGDSLYGNSNDRLFLHAASLVFKHPQTNEIIEVDSTVPF